MLLRNKLLGQFSPVDGQKIIDGYFNVHRNLTKSLQKTDVQHTRLEFRTIRASTQR